MKAMRNAWRRLAARPGHTLVSVLVLTLGLMAALFLFGAVNSMLLRPLPFPQADRLVALGWGQAGFMDDLEPLDARQWLVLREGMTVFEDVAVDGGMATVTLADGERVSRYGGAVFDHRLLPLLGVRPLLGRGFTAGDDRPGAPLVVLLGEKVWRNDFAADPAVLGRAVRVNGQPATVVGVLPAWFAYPYDQEVWLPRRLSADDSVAVQVVARLAPGITLAQARQAMAELVAREGRSLPGMREGARLEVIPLHQRFIDPVTRHVMWMMFAAGLLVLLLACVNVANMQLAAMLLRRRELAVRVALGAGRGHLLRELLAEATVMVLVATAVAAIGNELLARWFIAHMERSGMSFPFFIHFDYDWRDLVFVPLVALLACLASGLVPALRAARTEAGDALRDGSRGSRGGLFMRLTRILVVGEIALTLVPLVGAAMFVRGVQATMDFDHGGRTDPASVLTARVALFEGDYPQPDDRLRFHQRVLDQLRADAQVVAASVSNAVPGWSGGGSVEVAGEGQPVPPGGHVRAMVAAADPGFADVYGLRLREGRFFTGQDVAGAAPVAVIDALAAQQLWPDRPALGQRLLLDAGTTEPDVVTVVGIIEALHLRPANAARRPTVLRPLAQVPLPFATVAVQVRGDAMAFAPRLGAAVAAVDPQVPPYWVQTQEELIRQGRAGMVILTQMFAAVGVMALLLAAAGLYGVLAFSVAQRTREIGIRRAVGSDSFGVAMLVLRRLAGQVGTGLLIGLAVALPWSALLADPAFHTRPYDPAIFGLTVVLVLAVALLSALVPMRRALRVDPVVALRHE